MEKVQIFQDKKVRTHWDAEKEEWYFSVVDVVGVLTDSINPTDYLKKMRKRDPELAAFMGTNCPQVEMMTETGNVSYSQSHRPRQSRLSSGLRRWERNDWTRLPTQRGLLFVEQISIVPRATARDGSTNGCNQ